MQYTIRGVPKAVDAALRRRAKASSTSLNQAAVDALADGVATTIPARKRRDLSDIVGTWKEDKAFDDAIAAQDQIDPDLWR